MRHFSFLIAVMGVLLSVGGVHAEASALVGVFSGTEYPAAAAHDIDIEKHETRLFFRGTREEWAKIAAPSAQGGALR